MSDKKPQTVIPAARNPRPLQPHADSPDANGPGVPQEGVAETIHDAQADKANATHETVADARKDAEQQQADASEAAADALHPERANLEQLRGQLAAVRGLPQYATEERELLKTIETIEGKTPSKAEEK